MLRSKRSGGIVGFRMVVLDANIALKFVVDGIAYDRVLVSGVAEGKSV